MISDIIIELVKESNKAKRESIKGTDYYKSGISIGLEESIDIIIKHEYGIDIS